MNLYKCIGTGCWIWIFTGFLWGQETAFKSYAEMGLQGCQIHGDGYSGYNKAGWTLGFYLQNATDKAWFFKSGLQVSERGSQHNPTENNTEQYLLTLRYLDIPFLVNYKLKKSYIVSAGLTPSVLWNSNEIYNYQKFTSSQNFNRLDLMLNLSVQKWFTRWGFELRNSNSVIPVRNYAIAGNQINFGNPIANAFNRGLYNNIMVLSVLFKITP